MPMWHNGRYVLSLVMDYFTRGIAQSGSAPALGAGGRGFESLCPDQSSARSSSG